MTDRAAQVILNRAFLRVYRSYGMYLREAWPAYDVGDEAVIQQIIDEENRDASRLGQHLTNHYGSADPGHYRMDIGDIHYINFSRILPEWIADQVKLVKGLETDLTALAGCADADGVALLNEILAHERSHLDRLQTMKRTPVVAA